MLFPSHEYQILYRDLLLTFVRTFHKGNLDGIEITSREVWKMDLPTFNKVFFNGKIDKVVGNEYFYRRHIDLNPGRCFQGDINEEALSAALRYIGFKNDKGGSYPVSLPHQILAFRTKYKEQLRISKLTQKKLFQNWYNNILEDNVLNDKLQNADITAFEKDDEVLILDYNSLRAKELNERYSSKLSGTKWWLYFHDNDPYRVITHKKDSWVLAKLVLLFKENNGKLEVEIKNTKTHSHYDYVGKVDFSNSNKSLLIQCKTKTTLHPTRSVEIRFNFDDIEIEGALLFGQYINEEDDGHIVSGSMIFEHIPNNPFEDQQSPEKLIPELEQNSDEYEEYIAIDSKGNLPDYPIPCVYFIPMLEKDSGGYKENIDQVDKCILTFLHDPSINFRRTPLKVRYTKESLQEWFNSRQSAK